MHTIVGSANQTVTIGADQPFCIIGERINPTGRKVFQEQLRAGDLSAVEKDVADQIAGGAMVNSVTAEDERMELILPLVKKYGAAVIALPNDDKEIPEDPQRRFELTQYLVDTATTKYGIPIEDIVIDPLAMPIGADSQMVVRTLETIELIAEKIGVNMTLGASNVSFGMPDRHTLNSVFLPMAMGAGLTSAIMDARTPQIVTAVKAADLMLGNDEWGMNWIAAHRAREAAG